MVFGTSRISICEGATVAKPTSWSSSSATYIVADVVLELILPGMAPEEAVTINIAAIKGVAIVGSSEADARPKTSLCL